MLYVHYTEAQNYMYMLYMHYREALNYDLHTNLSDILPQNKLTLSKPMFDALSVFFLGGGVQTAHIKLCWGGPYKV